MKGLCHYQVITVSSSEQVVKIDGVAEEEPLQIWLKQPKGRGDSETRLLITTMRTPGDDINLVRGWLFSSGLISNMDNIVAISHSGAAHLMGRASNTIVVSLKQAINLDLQQHSRLEYANSSCGVCGQQSIEHLLEKIPSPAVITPFSISQQVICTLPEKLKQAQSLFSLTGGNHAVALCDQQGAILDLREDVGRHNAMDKLIGAHYETMLSGQFAVLLSGRVSFDLVQKAAMVHVPLLIAIGAPSSLAIDLCRECDIGLVGFVKETGFNIYHTQMKDAVYTVDLG